MTAISIALLTVWLIASVLAQFQVKPIRPLLRHDLFSLLPIWTFFAPSPSSYDYHLVYRLLLANGEFSRWIEVLPCGNRKLLEAFWNPQRRCKKILGARIRGLTKRLKGEAEKSFASSKAYLAVLAYLSALGHGEQAVAIEFRILRTEGFLAASGPRLVFQSESHRLRG